MKIAIRVDASSLIGTGHFMRCLTLAGNLKQCGAQVRFVCRFLPDHLRDMLRDQGYECIILNRESIDEKIDELTHSHWLGVSQQTDARETIQVLSDQIWDWIIVDHYALDVRWEIALRSLTRHIMTIDDLADRLHDCDVLLDDNLLPNIETRYLDKVPKHCRLLLGPAYVYLREEFLRLRLAAAFRVGAVHSVLIAFGGIDGDNYTSWAIEALGNMGISDLQIDVVVGAQNPWREKIQTDCDLYGLKCHVQPNDMANLMRLADLAIGAAGYTSYEFAAMKLPAILIPVSDIQIVFAIELQKHGVAYVPFSSKVSADEAAVAFHKVISSESMRSSMSLACNKIIDGKGSERIVNELLKISG